MVSRDPALADVRKRGLEAAGYAVISASDVVGLRKGCEKDVRIVIIGHSLPPSEKRRVRYEVRQHCGKETPILELHRGRVSISDDSHVAHHSHTPDDFVQIVQHF